METHQDKPKYPSLDEFESMTPDDKAELVLSLPIPVQQLLVCLASFGDSVRPDMARVVARISPEEFQEAQKTLLDAPFFSVIEDGRLQITDSLKTFINTDLRQMWEQQKKSQGSQNK